MRTRNISFAFVATCAALLIAEHCAARAGGGGGDGGGSGILAIILLPFFLFYSWVLSRKVARHQKQVEQLTEQLEHADKLWNYRDMKARVEDVFYRVQNAWMQRDQEPVKNCMTDRIYQKHKMQTDAMIANGTQNMLAEINITEIAIVGAVDRKDNSEDSFAAYIKGSMVDYTVVLEPRALLKGDDSKSESFAEIWSFLRKDNTWLLDEIDERAGWKDIDHAKVSSEEGGTGAR